jgi:hypothetical protein
LIEQPPTLGNSLGSPGYTTIPGISDDDKVIVFTGNAIFPGRLLNLFVT